MSGYTKDDLIVNTMACSLKTFEHFKGRKVTQEELRTIEFNIIELTNRFIKETPNKNEKVL